MRGVSENHQRTYSFFVRDSRPLIALVEAIAFVKDAHGLDLEPVANVIDPDALECLLDSSDSVTVSFTIADLAVTIEGSGEIEIAAPEPEETIHSDLEGVSTVLVLEESASGLCHELLSAFPPEQSNVIGILTSQSPDEFVREWTTNQPAKGTIIDVGGEIRSAAVATPTIGTPDFSIEPVSDLSAIGICVTERLAAWSGDSNTPAVCFNSLDDVLVDVDVKQVFMFLQPFLSRIRKAGGLVHVHLDPTAVDDRTRSTLETLFDAVIEVDAGSITVSQPRRYEPDGNGE